MELTITLMEIDIKGNGTLIFRMVLVHIITQMVIFIKANGLMENQMDRVTIYTMETKEFIKAIGKMGKNKVLAS